MVRTVRLAKPRGFCAGVVMAIDAVEEAARHNRENGRGALPVYHSIVHNDTVVSRLEERHGVHFVEDLDDLESVRARTEAKGGTLDDTVVFSAHGVSPAVRQQARDLGLSTIDATCPLVTKVHTEAGRYAREGYDILLIGDSIRHQEVIGTRGEAPEATTVVAVVGQEGADPSLADPRTVQVRDPDRVAVLTQTTLSVDDTMRTIALLRERFENLVVPARDDLCYATKNRQDAVRTIANSVDAFVIVSSTESSNGMRLTELAQRLSGRAIRVADASELDPAWFDEVSTVGVSSAASTPDDLVQDVVAWFRARNPDLELVEEGAWEDIAFRKPKRVPPEGTTP
ncbi:MAG: 4-hydroxy-3-methylbut-2-enyl diphosphate reductase [Trueperaceae bacterium]|nr:4-hydroxy-3-methylbut-2-enyl diphosphate reductase [Trueperaceae bacterium]